MRDRSFPIANDGKIALAAARQLLTMYKTQPRAAREISDSDHDFLESLVAGASQYGGLTRRQAQFVIGVRGKAGENPSGWDCHIKRYEGLLQNTTILVDKVPVDSGQEADPLVSQGAGGNPYMPEPIEQYEVDYLDEIADKLADEIETFIAEPRPTPMTPEEFPRAMKLRRQAYLSITSFVNGKRRSPLDD